MHVVTIVFIISAKIFPIIVLVFVDIMYSSIALPKKLRNYGILVVESELH